MSKNSPIETEHNCGEQPIAKIIEEHQIKTHDLVSASTEQITHKMVSKAAKGRRLSPKVKLKVLKALNKLLDQKLSITDLFNY